MKPCFGRRRTTGGAFLVREKNVSNNRFTYTYSILYIMTQTLIKELLLNLTERVMKILDSCTQILPDQLRMDNKMSFERS